MSDTRLIEEVTEQSRESWKQPHERAMACRDLEKLLAGGLQYFRAIRSFDEGWSMRVQANPSKFNADIAKQLRAHYEKWFQPCDKVLDEVERMEREFPVDGAEEFRKARLLVKSILRVSVDRLISAMDEVNSGKCSSLDEAINELDTKHSGECQKKAG